MVNRLAIQQPVTNLIYWFITIINIINNTTAYFFVVSWGTQMTIQLILAEVAKNVLLTKGTIFAV